MQVPTAVIDGPSRSGGMTDDKIAERGDQGDAWDLALNGDYDGALRIIDNVLVKAPANVVALRMKGNVLELKALDQLEYGSKKLMTSRDYLMARSCYEEILRQEPHEALVLFDLGDHYKNLDAHDQALSWYEQALAALRDQENRKRWPDAIGELIVPCADVGQNKKNAERAERLRTECEALKD